MKAFEWLLVSAALAFAALGLGAVVAPAGRVRARERAAGVLPELLALLDAWEAEGTHDVIVAPDGGLRTDAALQATYASTGGSEASRLEDTPHGRGAALDVWPVAFLDYVPKALGGNAARWATWAEVPDSVKVQFRAFGDFAKKRGLVWGGDWRSSTFPNGDQPHVQLRDWRSYPYPPRGVA